MADHVGQQIGNYRLVRLLGQGGFAEVYLGEHIHLNTRAAIKILRTQLSSNDIEQFRQEAQEARTVAQLEHPHIVRVLDFGVADTTPYLIMSYASNGTLRQRHPKGTRLPLPLVISYVKQIADALYYAHTRRLIHRDIKPENLLLGDRDEVLLGDFGIALVAQSSHYQSTKDMAGTVAYMAPEQIEAHPRPTSDQYSLGIVVYEWLTGDLPFHGSFTEIAVKHSLVPPPALREKNPTISPAIEQVVLTALAKEPTQRFATIQAFAHALEQAYSTSKVRLQQSSSHLSPPSQSAVQPDALLPTLPISRSIQPSGSAASTGLAADHISAQNIPIEVHQLAATAHPGTPQAVYTVKPRIISVNGYFLLFTFLLFGATLFTLKSSIVFAGGISLSCLLLFRGLGLQRTIYAFMHRSTYIFVYRDGMVLVKKNTTELLLWSQIAEFRSKHSDFLFFGLYTGVSHLYTILLVDGKVYHFGDDFSDIERLGNTIEQEVVRYLLPHAIASYNATVPIIFGDLQINQQGIGNNRMIVPWNNIQSIQVLHDFIAVKTRNQKGGKMKVLSANAQTIPNVPVLVALTNYILAKNATNSVP